MDSNCATNMNLESGLLSFGVSPWECGWQVPGRDRSPATSSSKRLLTPLRGTKQGMV
ncbi:hypothetical protein HPP92_003551 [Vanilla planifolia]|uniref:Uncharacterized protein n=1 Tax=Vanilla planifolia TaxID=51239 RepID=A0A835S3E8_VANPL|nr:hypothetical protein HPP92_003551 [Vanilla planifolia]